MSLIRVITDRLFDELKTILREYGRETEDIIKKRLRRLLITGIVISALSALMISCLSSASLFLEIGGLKYFMTFMPAWKAWDAMGLISALIGGLFLVGLYLVIRKQLRPS